MRFFKFWEKWKKIIWHCFSLSSMVLHSFWAICDQPVLVYKILKKIGFVKFCPLWAFFYWLISVLFFFERILRNSGLIFKNSPSSAPPDLAGSSKCFGSLLSSSVLEELPAKSTWYFYFGTEEVYEQWKMSWIVHRFCIDFDLA